MLVRIVQLHIEPELLSRFLELYSSHQSTIAGFKGCKEVKLLQDSKQPERVATLSLWNSEEDLNHYRYSEFFKNLWAQVKPMFASPAQAWSYFEWQNTQQNKS